MPLFSLPDSLPFGLQPCNAFAFTPGLPSSWPATLQPLALVASQKLGLRHNNSVPNLLHFLDPWDVYMKKNGIPLVGPECTSPSSWRLGPKKVNYKLCNVVTRSVLPKFYILRSEELQDDYVKLCKPKICMAMQKKV
jgi:hypothetical protein